MKNTNENAKANFASLVAKMVTFFATMVLGKRTRTGLLNSKETASGNASSLNAYRVFDNIIRAYKNVQNCLPERSKDSSKLDVQSASKLILKMSSLNPLFVTRIVKDDKGNDKIVTRDADAIEKAKRTLKANLKRDMAIAFGYSDDAIAQMKTFDFSDKQVLTWLKINAKFMANLSEYIQPIRVIKANGKTSNVKPNANAKQRRQSAKSKVMTANA